MDFQDGFNIVLTAFGFVVGFLLKSVWDAVKDLQMADKEILARIGEVEVLVAGQYIKREDMDNISRALFHKLDKIDAKLDTKVSLEFCMMHHEKK